MQLSVSLGHLELFLELIIEFVLLLAGYVVYKEVQDLILMSKVSKKMPSI